MAYTQYTLVEPLRWDALAYLLYGDETKIKVLTDANPQLAMLAFVKSGTTIAVPIIDQSDVIDNSLLPPWKR